MIILFSFLVTGSVVMAAPNLEECASIMSNAGITTGFAPVVAHAIHSLTLEDIRHYFKSDATEKNGIPTVNFDLEADQRVLPNAPLAGYDEDFSTMGLKSFDWVMRNMNRTGWGSRNTNVLVKLTHVLHMAELWDNIARSYKMVARLLDPESNICACATDIENNDVLNYLHFLAFKLRYPGITSGNDTITERYLSGDRRQKRSMDEPYDYDYDFCWDDFVDYDNDDELRPNFRKLDFDLSDFEILRDVAEVLKDGDKGTAAVFLDSADHWTWWRKMVKRLNMGEAAYYDIAVFLFCMLN